MKLEGEVAIVTGATRGIGRAIAERLADEGARVIGTATSEAGAATVQEYLGPKNGQGRVLDVTDSAAVAAFVADVEKSFGGLSILVNNAGITRDNLALRMKDEEWMQVIETNLNSVFRMCRAVMRPMMKARYGRIITIGSVVGSIGNFGQVNYVTAKAGLKGLSKTLAGELAPRNITVNIVAPGFIDTDMTRHLPDSVKQDILGKCLIPRLGKPEEVASAVAFLASREASYITGHELHVNGGLYMA